MYLVVERGKGRKKRGRETSICGCLLHAPTGDLACNPGMCPDWEWYRRPFASQAGTQSTELHQPGLIFIFLILYKNAFFQGCTLEFTKDFIYAISLSTQQPGSSPILQVKKKEA